MCIVTEGAGCGGGAVWSFFLYKIIYLNKNGRCGERGGEAVSVLYSSSVTAPPRAAPLVPTLKRFIQIKVRCFLPRALSAERG